jgi:hypothetical protein
MPYPGTEIYKTGLDKNIIKEDKWKKYALNPEPNFTPPLWEETLSYQELLKLHRWAYKSFYLRISYIIRQLSSIRSLPELYRRIIAGFKIVKLK